MFKEKKKNITITKFPSNLEFCQSRRQKRNIMETAKLKKLAQDMIWLESQTNQILVYGSLASDSIWVISRFEKIDSKEFNSIVFDHEPISNPIVGFLNYENLRHGDLCDSFIFRIIEGYEFDFSSGDLRSLTDAGDVTRLLDILERQRFAENTLSLQEDSSKELLSSNIRFELIASDSNQEYISKVERVIDQIKDGRFYQMNLLRRFTIKNVTRQKMLLKWIRDASSYGAMMILGELEIYSFSPEHFVTLKSDHQGFSIHTSPIKGTLERGSDFDQDEFKKQSLAQSEKDRAELAMIVDLMRNDLRKVAKPLTVKVIDPGSVQTFATLHHLVAELQAKAIDRLTMSDVIKALFPAGSITGAPKIEVMDAIEEIENSSRGFFMGSAFKMETTKQFESTVMIRTVLKQSGEYLYAAGSGIVIKSQPEQELNEIRVKCRVLTGVDE